MTDVVVQDAFGGAGGIEEETEVVREVPASRRQVSSGFGEERDERLHLRCLPIVEPGTILEGYTITSSLRTVFSRSVWACWTCAMATSRSMTSGLEAGELEASAPVDWRRRELDSIVWLMSGWKFEWEK